VEGRSRGLFKILRRDYQAGLKKHMKKVTIVGLRVEIRTQDQHPPPPKYEGVPTTRSRRSMCFPHNSLSLQDPRLRRTCRSVCQEAGIAIGTRVRCESMTVSASCTELSHTTRPTWPRFIVARTNGVRTSETKNEAPQLMRGAEQLHRFERFLAAQREASSCMEGCSHARGTVW
jgi:hypothetical protein